MTRLEEIKGRLERATPGPWLRNGNRVDAVNEEKCGLAFIAAPVAIIPDMNDIPLIANAPSDLAYLIARVEALQEVYEAAQEERRIEYGPKLREALKNASEVMG